jgi:hypothetical protein
MARTKGKRQQTLEVVVNHEQVTPALQEQTKPARAATAAEALASMRHSACAELVQNAPAIMRALREKAEEGSYLHARFLLDLVNETAAADHSAETENAEESLAAILLKHLQLDDENSDNTAEANEGRRIESQVT